MTIRKLHTTNTLDIFHSSSEIELKLQIISGGISAGFPSPADDFIDSSIDLNKELIKNPSSTFFGKVKGDSMKDAGIHNGDLLIIDKSINPQDGKIAVCFIDGEFTIKKIKLEKDCCWLIPANESYQPIKVTSDNNFLIWGMVINVIKYF